MPTGAAGQNAGRPVGEQEAEPQADGAKPEPPAGPGGPAGHRLRAGEAQPVAEGGGWLTSVTWARGGFRGSRRRLRRFFDVTAEPEAAAAAAGGGAPGAAPGPGRLEAAAAGEGGAAAEGGRPAGLPDEAAGREDRGGAEAGAARQREVGAQEGSGEGDDIITQLLLKLHNHHVSQKTPPDRDVEN